MHIIGVQGVNTTFAAFAFEVIGCNKSGSV